MKVVQKQRNSRMCVICGMENEYGVKAPFYSMEDGSVMTLFRYRKHHQSYPGRVHGGMIGAMIDEMGLRALWANHGAENEFGITLSLETSYRRAVPYGIDLLGRGHVVRESGRFFIVESEIMDCAGEVLANGSVKYMKLDPAKIAPDAGVHEEMCYFVEDGVASLNFMDSPSPL